MPLQTRAAGDMCALLSNICFDFLVQAVLEQLRIAENKAGPLELLLILFRALGAGKFETLYGIFGGSGAPGALSSKTLLDILYGMYAHMAR